MTRAARRWAVLPAAGRGERFGAATPKQYQKVHGRTVLSWSMRALLAEQSICGIVVAVAAGDRRFSRLPEARDARVRSCIGGARRELSVAHALECLADEARDHDWVLVHDAARPCLHRDDLRRLLTRAGYRVITAKDGLDAMTQLQTESPAVMLLDIEMPRADGFEVATFVRNNERIKGLPIIMITSRSGEKHRERARQIGVDKYLIKPYQEDQLLTEVRDLLAERRF